MVTEFGVPTAGSQPLMITQGIDGNLWFTEYASSKIGRITTGGVVTEFQASGNPWGIAAVSGGTPLVHRGDQQQGRIPQSDQWPHGRDRGVSDADGEPVDREASRAVPTGTSGTRGLSSNKIGRVNTTTAMFTEFVIPTAGAVPAQIVTGPDNNLWFTEETANRIGRLAP